MIRFFIGLGWCEKFIVWKVFLEVFRFKGVMGFREIVKENLERVLRG